MLDETGGVGTPLCEGGQVSSCSQTERSWAAWTSSSSVGPSCDVMSDSCRCGDVISGELVHRCEVVYFELSCHCTVSLVLRFSDLINILYSTGGSSSGRDGVLGTQLFSSHD